MNAIEVLHDCETWRWCHTAGDARIPSVAMAPAHRIGHVSRDVVWPDACRSAPPSVLAWSHGVRGRCCQGLR